jgi:hypothetical protein
MRAWIVALSLIVVVSHVHGQDLLRGPRGIPDDAQRRDNLEFEQRQRARQQQERQDLLLQQDLRRRDIENQAREQWLRDRQGGAGFVPAYPVPVVPTVPGYVPPAQVVPGCRALQPVYDAFGRFLGNACVR